MRARFFLAVVLLSLGSTASLRAYVTTATPLVSEQTAILDNSAESAYPAENPWLNPESRNGLLCAGDPVNNTDSMGLAASGGGQEQNRPYVPYKPVEDRRPPAVRGLTSQGGGGFWSGPDGLPSGGGGGGDGGYYAPPGRNPDGTPILRALPVNNTIAVLGMGGIFGWRTAGNVALLESMRGVGSVIFRDFLGVTLQSLVNNGIGGATLVGYSRGGVVAVNEAARFSSISFNVIGIDPVTVGLPGRSISLSSNVVSGSSYYQQNPHNYVGSNPFIGSPFSSSTITPQNYNFTGYSQYNHNTIVGNVMPLVLRDLGR